MKIWIGIILSTSLLAGASLHMNMQSLMASIYAAQSVRAAQQGNAAGAVGRMKSATELSPRVSTYPFFLSSYYSRSNVPTYARREIDRATGGNPHYYRHWLHGGLNLWQLGFRDAAVEHLEQAHTLVPNSMPMRELLAQAYINMGWPDKAVDLLEVARRLPSNTSWAYKSEQLLGFAYMDLGNNPAAKHWLLASLEHAPFRWTCADNIKALQQLETAVSREALDKCSKASR